MTETVMDTPTFCSNKQKKSGGTYIFKDIKDSKKLKYVENNQNQIKPDVEP